MGTGHKTVPGKEGEGVSEYGDTQGTNSIPSHCNNWMELAEEYPITSQAQYHTIPPWERPGADMTDLFVYYVHISDQIINKLSTVKMTMLESKL